ncbi:MAG: UDP-N-acetylmuramate dehydrogenase [Dehalococcoidia bacterium]|nr:UDP-N-acetylmuramate dehydrogenase [Dehalococcoidia bacterium]
MNPSPSPLSPPAGIDVVREEPLARHTYLRLGGPAEFFATPATLDELTSLTRWARAAGLAVLVLGGGSNVLVADAGVRGLVLSLRRACSEVRFGALVVAGAGVMLPALARAAAEHDHGGLEFAIGIPGSVGGALQSNAGIGDSRDLGALVEAVTVLDDSTLRVLARDELQFGYRTSSLRASGLTVVEATLRLEPRPRAEIEAEMRRLLEARAVSQPTAERNAGSIFRNPPGDYAGRLIEEAGCKGLHVRGARVSTMHANFIVHDGAATARDVAELMTEVQRRVHDHSGIDLRPEIDWWGDGEPPAVFH